MMVVFTQEDKPKTILFHSAICVGIYLGITFLFYCFPVAYIYICTEDSWVEYGSFVMYFLASLILAMAMKKNHQLFSPGYVLFCLMFFFIAMEEISWGQRIIGFETPQVFDSHNMQSEINFHNLSAFPKDNIIYILVTIWAFVIPFISKKIVWFGNLIRKLNVPMITFREIPYMLLSLYFLFCYFVILDKEFGEMLLSITFLMFAVNIYRDILPGQRKIHERNMITLTIVSTLLITSFLVYFKSNFPDYRWRLNEYATIKFPKHGLHKQAQTVFQHIAANKKMRKNRSYLHYGSYLKSINSPMTDTVLHDALDEQKNKSLLRPRDPEINYIVGRIYKLMDRNDLAKREFDRAIQKADFRIKYITNKDKIAKTLKLKSEIYWALEDKAKALDTLSMALSYAQEASTEFRINEMIESIENDDLIN